MTYVNSWAFVGISWPWLAPILLVTLSVLFYIVGCASLFKDEEKNEPTKSSSASSRNGKVPNTSSSKIVGKPMTKWPKLPPLPKSSPVKPKTGRTSSAPVRKSKAKSSSAVSSAGKCKSKVQSKMQTKSIVAQPLKSNNSAVKGHQDSGGSFARVEPRKTEHIVSEEILASTIPAPDEPLD